MKMERNNEVKERALISRVRILAKRRIIGYLITTIILAILSGNVSADLRQIDKFKDHMQSSQSLNEKVKLQEIQEYLSNLSDEELFDLLNDVAVDTPALFGQQNVLASHLKYRWRDNLPTNKIVTEIKNKKRDKHYRKHMISFLTWSTKQKVRKNAQDTATINTVKAVCKEYRGVTDNTTEFKEIRAEAISGSAILLGILRESSNLTQKESDDYGNHFLDKVKSTTEDEVVRATSVKALRSLDDRRVLPLLRNVINDTETKEVFLTRVSITTVAKMNDEEAVSLISKQLDFTKDKDIFGTSVYALGLYNNPSTLKYLLKNKDRFDANTAKSLFRGQKNLIEKILKNNDRAHLIDAINLVAFAELEELKESLHPFVTDSDRNVRLSAFQALLMVGNKEDFTRIFENTKTENDREVLELRKKVEVESKLIFIEGGQSNEPTESHSGRAK